MFIKDCTKSMLKIEKIIVLFYEMSFKGFSWRGTADSSSGGKFWHITVDGSETVTTFGKLNTNGRVSRKSHNDHAVAMKFAEKQVNTKKKGGYVETK